MSHQNDIKSAIITGDREQIKKALDAWLATTPPATAKKRKVYHKSRLETKQKSRKGA